MCPKYVIGRVAYLMGSGRRPVDHPVNNPY